MFKNKYFILSVALVLLLAILGTVVYAITFTQGVTSVSSSSVKIWFQPSATCSYVIVHYTVTGGGQQNVNMTYNTTAAQWEYTVTGLVSGNVITYNFTYNTGGVQYDTGSYTYTVGSGTATPTATKTPTPTTSPSGVTPTATKTPTPTVTPTLTPGGDVLATIVSANASSQLMPAANSCDGNTGTRWESTQGVDPQWIYWDLGTNKSLSRIIIEWETASAANYTIQGSNDATNWNILATVTNASQVNHNRITTNLSGSYRYVKMNGTTRTTQYGYSIWETSIYVLNGPAPTPTPTRTPTGPTGAPTPTVTPSGSGFWGDTASIPPAKNVLTFKFINRTNGKYPDSQVFWSFKSGSINEVHSIAEKDTYDMPANSAGRMYFGLGAAPNAANPSSYWDFIEFTISSTMFNANTTRVDAFGLKLAMRLHCADGYDAQVGENQSTFAEDRSVTFQRYLDSVPAEFDNCAQIQAPYRIVEPGAAGFNTGGPYANYYNSYVDQMWANNGITIPKPGPNGSGLGSYPDLSAAIFRHVGSGAGNFNANGSLKNQSLWSNPSTFYQAAPAHYYAKFCHDIAINGLSYGFPYDDVGGYSSFISHNTPQWCIVAVGW